MMRNERKYSIFSYSKIRFKIQTAAGDKCLYTVKLSATKEEKQEEEEEVIENCFSVSE